MDQGCPRGLSSSLIHPNDAMGIGFHYLIESSEDEGKGSELSHGKLLSSL